jgi:hypothetical protein
MKSAAVCAHFPGFSLMRLGIRLGAQVNPARIPSLRHPPD